MPPRRADRARARRTAVLAKRLLIPLFLTAVAATALVGCEGSNSDVPERFAFTMNFTGMTPHIGQLLEIRVVHVATQVEVARTRVESIDTPAFGVTIPDILVAGERYQVDFYADLNRNRHYNAPPVDHAWRRFIGPVAAANTTLNFAHDPNWVDIEWPPAP
jgi:hypothetical protein